MLSIRLFFLFFSLFFCNDNVQVLDYDQLWNAKIILRDWLLEITRKKIAACVCDTNIQLDKI